MNDKGCSCGGGKPEGTCPVCSGAAETLPYWCEVCRRAVAEKRCPFCGLKARKMQTCPGKGR